MPQKDEQARKLYARTYYRDLARQRRIEGLCIGCGKPSRDGKAYCQKCADANNQRTMALRKANKQKAVEYLGGQCIDCGIRSEYAAIYEFHHMVPSNKIASIARLMERVKNFEKLKSELDKCVLLCANCHRIRHAIEDEGAP